VIRANVLRAIIRLCGETASAERLTSWRRLAGHYQDRVCVYLPEEIRRADFAVRNRRQRYVRKQQ